MGKKRKSFDEFISDNMLTILIGIFTVSVIIAVVPAIIYKIYFNGTIVANHLNWGTFGDYIGGTLNPIFGFFALVAILLTIVLQNRELKLTRDDMKKQSFENTFFQMLRIHNDILNSIDLSKKIGTNMSGPPAFSTTSGRDCFVTFLSRLKNEYRNTVIDSEDMQGGIKDDNLFKRTVKGKADELELIQNGYTKFWGDNKHELGHYFRYLFNVFKFVKDSDIVDKEKYTGIVKAQLSDQELALLFYNCITEHGRDNFYPMVNDYHLIDNMPSSLLFNKYHVGLYEKKAYKTNKEMIELYDELGDLGE